MALPDQPELRRRVKAARMLAGYPNIKDLADAIGENARLGERTLRKLEGGERSLQTPHLRVIAEACRLPLDFFTIHSISEAIAFAAAMKPEALALTTSARVDDIEQRMIRIETFIERFEEAAPPSPPDELLRPPATSQTTAPRKQDATNSQGKGSRRGTGR